MKKVNKWSLEDVKKIVERVENMTGEKLDLELNYNPRLKTTLAWCKNRVSYQTVRENGKTVKKVNWIKPYCLEFGTVILNVEKFETFEQTVLHEIAHALANKKYNDDCNHDYRFKEICEKIGCYESGAKTDEKDILDTMKKLNNEKMKKGKKENKSSEYVVKCSCCGKALKTYKTHCDTVKKIENGVKNWTCGHCHSDDLYIERH
jgi:predicted SprT family Zn-dependent metalloprotease